MAYFYFMPTRRIPANKRLRKVELVDAHGRPMQGTEGSFVYDANGDIFRQRIVKPTEENMADAIRNHFAKLKVTRPLTLEERQTLRGIEDLRKKGILNQAEHEKLRDTYTNLLLKTPNPEFERHLEALEKDGKKLKNETKKRTGIVLP
jgi:hypothetical protein